MADKTSIDDLFESDDDDYTIETDGSPEDDIDLDDEDYSQYLVDDTDEVVNSKAPVEEKTLEDEFNELKQQQSQKTEETPVETQTSDEEEIEKTEQKLTDDEILEIFKDDSRMDEFLSGLTGEDLKRYLIYVLLMQKI